MTESISGGTEIMDSISECGPFQLPLDDEKLFKYRDRERELNHLGRHQNLKVHQKSTRNSLVKGISARCVMQQRMMYEPIAKCLPKKRVPQGPIMTEKKNKPVKRLPILPEEKIVLGITDDSTGTLALGLEGSPGKSTSSKADCGTFLTATDDNGKDYEETLTYINKKVGPTMREYVQKKRQMFLVLMSLDVTKAEILKLEEKVRRREEALKKSQSMLDEDVTRFDAFLQTNDRKARKARKLVEAVTKKREMNAKIKQLKASVAQEESEITKLQEVQQLLKRYEDFLWQLTPQDWKDEKAAQKREKMEKMKDEWCALQREDFRKREVEPEYERYVADVKAEMEAVRSKMTVRQFEEDYAAGMALVEEYKTVLMRKCPSKEEFGKEWEEKIYPTIEDDPQEQYFKDSKQLMDILVMLEEKNLFLIQDAQSIEESIDEVNLHKKKNSEELESKIATLKSQIASLERVTRQEIKKSQKMQEQLQANAGTQVQDKKTEELREKIRTVYIQCGFEGTHDPDALKMLASIEAKLEELLKYLDQVETEGQVTRNVDGKEVVVREGGSDLILQLERQLELERRQRLRQERLVEEQKKQEKRLQASLARSQAPVVRRVGKQIMFRSAPNVVKVRVRHDDSEDKENERTKQLFGFYLDKDGIPQTELQCDKDKTPNDIPYLGENKDNSGRSVTEISESSK